jgi:methyl acetate hydrolase
LSHLLACRLRRTPSSILSAESIDSLFVGTLPEGAIDQDHNAGIYAMLRVERGLGAVDWSTALCLYQGSGQKAGWGRYPGSVGWAGAGGTEYWLDERAGIAVVMTTQVLPVFSKAVAAMKERLERAIYEELAI